MELANHIVACAPFGGPIAISRDPSKLVQVGMGGGFASLQTVVSLFSSPGVLLATITWSAHGAPLVDMGWTKDLNLVLVAQDGSIIQVQISYEHRHYCTVLRVEPMPLAPEFAIRN